MYNITEYSKKQAEKLGVEIKPSTRKDKKIDVFKNDKKIASIGAKKKNGEFYKDYPNYIKEKGIDYAKERRKLYKERHAKDCKKKGTPGFYSCNILW